MSCTIVEIPHSSKRRHKYCTQTAPVFDFLWIKTSSPTFRQLNIQDPRYWGPVPAIRLPNSGRNRTRTCDILLVRELKGLSMAYQGVYVVVLCLFTPIFGSPGRMYSLCFPCCLVKIAPKLHPTPNSMKKSKAVSSLYMMFIKPRPKKTDGKTERFL
jgi:hypothetical protein